jgi:endo-1,4-beta-xylanase
MLSIVEYLLRYPPVGGGIGWTGSTICETGSTCIVINPYYSQCLPNTATVTPTSSSLTVVTPPSSASTAPAPSGTGLDAHFKAKGKLYWGTCSDSNRFSDTTDSRVTITQFGQLTPENSMKWDAVSD